MVVKALAVESATIGGGILRVRRPDRSRPRPPARDAAPCRPWSSAAPCGTRRARALCTAPAARGSSRATRLRSHARRPSSTTQALATSPFIGSGTPATPTSSTAGCAVSTSSISRGQTWNPLVLIRSFLRSTQEHVAVRVEVREVSRVQPCRAVRVRSQRFGCLDGIVPVLRHVLRRADDELPNFAGGHLAHARRRHPRSAPRHPAGACRSSRSCSSPSPDSRSRPSCLR